MLPLLPYHQISVPVRGLCGQDNSILHGGLSWWAGVALWLAQVHMPGKLSTTGLIHKTGLEKLRIMLRTSEINMQDEEG